MPFWTLRLASLASVTLLLTFVWGVCIPPQPYIAPAFRDPEIARKAALIRPGSALDRNMRRINVEYRVEGKERERFNVMYLNAQAKKVRIADATGTEIAGWDEKNAEIRSPDGVLLKEWRMPLRVERGSLLFVSAQSKQKESLLKVTIIVDGFHGDFNACTAKAKHGQKEVECRYKLLR